MNYQYYLIFVASRGLVASLSGTRRVALGRLALACLALSEGLALLPLALSPRGVPGRGPRPPRVVPLVRPIVVPLGAALVFAVPLPGASGVVDGEGALARLRLELQLLCHQVLLRLRGQRGSVRRH